MDLYFYNFDLDFSFYINFYFVDKITLIDYKFYCFHGIPDACGVFYDRNLDTHQNGMTPYDMEWNKHEEWRREDIIKSCKDNKFS